MDAVAVLMVGFGGWLAYASYRNYSPIAGIFTILSGGTLQSGAFGTSASANTNTPGVSHGTTGTGATATGGGPILNPGNTAEPAVPPSKYGVAGKTGQPTSI